MPEPIVSVIMPAWNREAYIADAMRSVLRETIPLELIVVDDGSTDGTISVVETVARGDARVRLLRGEHRGVAAARNLGIAATRGAFISFLDSDDISVEGRLARQVAFLDAHPDIAFVTSDLLFVSELGPDLNPVSGSRTERDHAISLTVTMLRREVFDRRGVCDETLRFGEDVDLFLRWWEHDEKCAHDGDVAVFYRRHDDNMTNDNISVRKAFLECIFRSLARRRVSGRPIQLPPEFSRRLEGEARFAHV